jgi:peptide deformylase
MALLQVAKLGDPVLRQKAALVDLEDLKSQDNEMQALIDDMIETMHEEGGVGLAAPQIFQSLRLVVIECSLNERYSEAPNIPLTILINPSITYYGQDTVTGWEGCLSLKDLRGLVPRSSNIVVQYFDRKGVSVTVNAEGFFAVVLQHEIDHLDGKVFLDRMTDLSQLAYVDEFEKYIADKKSLESESA